MEFSSGDSTSAAVCGYDDRASGWGARRLAEAALSARNSAPTGKLAVQVARHGLVQSP